MFKKFAALFFVLAIGVGFLPGVGQAQTSTDLLSQIQALNTQLIQLQQQQQQLQSQKQQAVSNLLTTLAQGSQGDAVTTLQALLAADPTIYPEGLVTGFFGPATARAVKRFQKMNGFEQVGNVGPKTLTKLNEWMLKYQLKFEDDNSSNSQSGNGKNDDKKDNKFKIGRTICTPVALGHLTAPGWLRKDKDGKNERRVVPVCRTIPPGWNNGGGTTTSTPPVVPPGCYLKQVWCVAAPCNPVVYCPVTSSTDAIAPIVTNIAAAPSDVTASVSWTTNENADSQVIYGTSTAYGSQTTLDAGLILSHVQTLTGLSVSTLYHYQVRSKDATGNLTTSPDQTFTTLAAPADTVAPVITNIAAVPIAHGATISWTTNENADSQVIYGTSTAYGSQTTLNATLLANHSQVLSGLDASTLYHYQVRSKDAAGNLTTSPDQTFTTIADVTAPVISSLSIVPNPTSAGVYFLTNLQTTAKIYYSTVTPLDVNATSTLSIVDGALLTVHNYTIPTLATGTAYYYRIEATSNANGVATSQGSFVTPTQ